MNVQRTCVSQVEVSAALHSENKASLCPVSSSEAVESQQRSVFHPYRQRSSAALSKGVHRSRRLLPGTPEIQGLGQG